MPDTTYGITYPDSSGHDRLWEHFQAIADDVQTILARMQEPIAQVSATTNSSAIGTTETVVSSLPSTTYLANRAYMLRAFGGIIMSSATSQAAWKIRKTNASGTVLIEWPRSPVLGSTLASDMGLQDRLFIVGASDVTTVLCLTATATASSTVTHAAGPTYPRGLRVVDVGPASAWTHGVTLS